MIELVPYVQMDGKRNIHDEIIKGIYLKMKLDGTLDTVFLSDIKTPDEFLGVMQRVSNIPVVVLQDSQVAGIAWLNSLEDNHCFAHFCFFKETWGKTSYEIGEKLLDYWFSFQDNGKKMLDVIIGRVPVFNQRAIRFTEKLGFKRVGEIPLMEKLPNGDRVSAMILYKTRYG